MSAKWQRSKRWDDDNIPPGAWPARVLLRAFSSIPLAVVLLTFIALYAVAASVPVGLLALAPTWAVYALTLLGAVGVVAVAPTFVLVRLTRRAPRAPRFAAAVIALVVLTVAAMGLWSRLIWPALHYDPATGRGLRLFAGFCEQYRSTTMRRLPMLEMSELEFYSWWPLRVVLLAFVANMVTATVRRIEFTFVNIGVLTVHTGIVMIALGSVYYRGLKLEGDTLLLAGEPGPDGTPAPGPPEEVFYDNTRVALWAQQHGTWEQRPLSSVPRYNDYGLGAAGPTALDAVGRRFAPSDEGFERPLTLRVPEARPPAPGSPPPVDGDIALRILGYAGYAEGVQDWVRGAPGPGQSPTPGRFLDFVAQFPGQARSAFRFFVIPDQPAHRWDTKEDAIAVEWTRGMSEDRWASLTSDFPAGASHALVVEVPEAEGREAFRAVYAATPGEPIDMGASGYRLEVRELAPQPPFRIITPGYEGATSSVAIVRVTPPVGPAFDRWAYHRFPEIGQDMVDAEAPGGRARRRPADPGIRIDYLDASIVQVYLDERPDGSVRVCVRAPDGTRRVVDRIEPGGTLEEFLTRRDPASDPKVDLVLGERWEHAEPIERPSIVPEHERRNDEVGTHSRAMLAVEVSVRGGSWRRVVWLEFNRYVHRPVGGETTHVMLPDGRTVELAFGRLAHRLPGFMVQLVDFQAIKYEHRGAPRDYQSIVRVVPTADGPRFNAYEHITKLNAPLQAPFLWSESRNVAANTVGLVRSRFNPGQFKFSQSGWDQEGWDRTQAMADQGQLRRPFARFTILGVGNNPGIHVIALGGIMMSVGIPWAFYVKPWILRRRRARLQAEYARGPAVEQSSPEPLGAPA